MPRPDLPIFPFKMTKNEPLNAYLLTKKFYSKLEHNPDMQLHCKPSHISVYFRIIELQNKVGWHFRVLGLPTESVMQYACIASAKTYFKVLQDLERWGLFKTLSYAVNQFTSRKITLYPEEAEAADNTIPKQAAKKEAKTEECLEAVFAEEAMLEENSKEYEKIRTEWNEAKNIGRQKDQQVAEAKGQALQSKVQLQINPIRDLFRKYLQVRKELGKPISPTVATNLFAQLRRHSQDHVSRAKLILEQAIAGGWARFYPISEAEPPTPQKIPTQDYQRYCSNPKKYAYQPPRRV